MSDVSVLIITYNSAAEIGACLDAVLLQDVDLEVVVVDNASTDGTAEVVAARGDTVTLLRNEVNVGYAAGVNQAFAASSAPVVALVNPDCAPDPGCLAILLDHLEASPGVGGASASLRNEDGSPQLFARREPGALGALLTMTDLGLAADRRLFGGRHLRSRRYADEFEGGLTEVAVVDCPAAACILLWRGLIGPRPMDPALPLMFNDGDLYRRLRARGYRCEVVPAAGAVHLYGTSIRRVPRARMRAEYVSSLRRYSAPWPPLSRWMLWLGLAADGGLGVVRTSIVRGGATTAARGRSRGTLGGLGLPGGVQPWLTRPPTPLSGGRAALRRVRSAPRRTMRSATRRLRRQWFLARLRLAGWWTGCSVELDVDPTADLGWRQLLELRPRTDVVVRIGAGAHIRDDVVLRLGGTLDIGPLADIRWGCTLNVNGTLRFEGRNVLGRGTAVHADGTMVWQWGATTAEFVTVVDTEHQADGSAVHVLDLPVPQADVTIGATSFLAAHAVVTSGVSVGPGSIVGANSVVTRDLPGGVVAAGAPAKPIRSLPNVAQRRRSG